MAETIKRLSNAQPPCIKRIMEPVEEFDMSETLEDSGGHFRGKKKAHLEWPHVKCSQSHPSLSTHRFNV